MKRRNLATSGVYSVLAAVFFITAVKVGTAQASTCMQVESWTKAQIQEKTNLLIVQAERNPAGIATFVIERCTGSLVLLSVRAKSGRAELHVKDSDYIFILDGAGAMMTGGVIVNPKHTAPGEIRGEARRWFSYAIEFWSYHSYPSWNAASDSG